MAPAPMQPPPGWGLEPLTDFLQSSTRNAWATYMQPETSELVRHAQRIDAVFQEAIDLMSGPNADFVEALMLVNACCAFRTAVQLAMETKSSETFPVIRTCLEYSMLAVHMHRNPQLVETWLRRGESLEHRKAVRRHFQTSAMLDTLTMSHNAIGERVSNLYELSIDFGAHPNEQALFGRLSIDHLPNGDVRFQTMMLGNVATVPAILKSALQAGVTALECFWLIYRERFDLMHTTDPIEALKQGL